MEEAEELIRRLDEKQFEYPICYDIEADALLSLDKETLPQGCAKLAGKSRITLLYLIRSKQIINADRFLQKAVGVYYSIIWYLLIILVFDFTLKFNKSEQRP